MKLSSSANSDYINDDQRWAAVQARDSAADEHFVYAVRTTGVYCRPSSSSRLPKRDNVEFFDTAEAAEAAGYRPSQRIAGDQTAAAERRVALVTHACRLIESSETLPSLEELAAQSDISPFHFHRIFKAETGLTPKAYASAFRARKLRTELGAVTQSVADAIYGAGFSSNSRFYEASDGLLGMCARDYRAGGANAQIRFAVGQCSLGAILVAQSQRGICAILLGDDPDALVRDLQDQFSKSLLVGDDEGFEQLVAQVVGFIEAPSLGLNLPLDVRGTAFQERVWRALREIPPGATVDYAQLAERIGAPKAVRAVAQACGANRIAVAIPCHRVVRRDGDISGYRWGVERKHELLQREAQAHNQKIFMTKEIECIDRLAWIDIAAQLDQEGYAVLPGLLGETHARTLAQLPGTPNAERCISLAFSDQGRGNLFYLAQPLPKPLEKWRSEFYKHLAPIANRWNEALDVAYRYPDTLTAFLARNRRAGQTHPQSVLSRLREEDYQTLHQRAEGEHVFPLQLVALLSEPEQDFTGGEFVMTEQRPRMQSRPMVLPLKLGDVAIITTAQRPHKGGKGYYRVDLKHAISRVRRGERIGLELLLHNAV